MTRDSVSPCRSDQGSRGKATQFSRREQDLRGSSFMKNLLVWFLSDGGPQVDEPESTSTWSSVGGGVRLEEEEEVEQVMKGIQEEEEQGDKCEWGGGRREGRGRGRGSGGGGGGG